MSSSSSRGSRLRRRSQRAPACLHVGIGGPARAWSRSPDLATAPTTRPASTSPDPEVPRPAEREVVCHALPSGACTVPNDVSTAAVRCEAMRKASCGSCVSGRSASRAASWRLGVITTRVRDRLSPLVVQCGERRQGEGIDNDESVIANRLQHTHEEPRLAACPQAFRARSKRASTVPREPANSSDICRPLGDGHSPTTIASGTATPT